MYDVDINAHLVSDPERIKSLAQYKKIHRDFIEDKRSVYWTDGPIKVQSQNKLTQNQKSLAHHKLPHINYKGDRPSPIWRVSKRSLRAKINDRQTTLAIAKAPHPAWRKDQPVQTQVALKTMTAMPTEHILRLSMPKEADSRYLRPSISLEELGALKNEGRQDPAENLPDWVDRLSSFKKSPNGYKPDRHVSWVINHNTKSAIITEHVDKLSKLQRVGKRPGPDPNVVDNPYAVSRAAIRPLPEIQLQDLLVQLSRVLNRAENYTSHQVALEPLSTRERMSNILNAISAAGDQFVSFSSLFRPEEGRSGVIVTFIAMMELIKESLLEIVQSDPFAPIHVKLKVSSFETVEP